MKLHSGRNGIPAILCLLFLVCIAGCATSVPFDYPRTPSFAYTDTEDSYLGQAAATLLAPHPDESGFYVLTDGIDALAIRLLLAKDAERSIDAQYFVIQPDMSGHLFADALLKAADRGVRVRLLIDDIQTIGLDRGMAVLAAHENIELRVFNPFANRSAMRNTEYVTNLKRVNHRMHNKSFTVDNIATVVGGRNIGDDYFDADLDFRFGDFEVLAFGDVTKDVSESFDVYWNSDISIPAEALVDEPDPGDLQDMYDEIKPLIEKAKASKYGAALKRTLLQNITSAESSLFWGTPKVVYDDPEKAMDPDGENVRTLISQLRHEVLAAESELIIVSPYFVPGESGVVEFQQLRDRNVEVMVITNSLASTDMVPVHSGYSRYRKPLLKMGVTIYEVRADSHSEEKKSTGLKYSVSALHAKAFVVDRHYVFVGSFNWDPRSVKINTELGIYIDSPEFAVWLADGLQAYTPKNAFSVRLDDDGDIEWVEMTDDGEIIFDNEPDTGFWRRFNAGFFKLLPIEKQL
jgi:putative cardiolipin synthase